MDQPKHTLTGKQPKSINIEKGVFESCGKFYYCYLEAMSFARLKRFAELMPVIVYGRKYMELAHFIHELRVKMTTGEETIKQTFFEVATALTNWDQYLLNNAGEFYDNVIDDTLRFCALMWVEKDEDMNTIDDRIIEEKVSNWKTDMNMMDFFFFSKQQVPRYQELLANMLDQENLNKAKAMMSQPVN